MRNPLARRQAPPPEPAPEPASESVPAAAPEPESPPVSIAVVDDDEDFRDLIRLGLSKQGFNVVGVAADATEAIELVTRTLPDIVLLDLHMPDMGGIELLPFLREPSPKTRFVAYSTIGTIGATHMVERALEAGFVGFIGKNVSIDSIVKHLDRVVNMGRMKLVRPFPLDHDYD